ncbi:hypothetical protein [Streptomyces jumonjinensis]|nr:hypothetical protein [Streptomyces jumonjinensis]
MNSKKSVAAAVSVVMALAVVVLGASATAHAKSAGDKKVEVIK